MGPSAVPDPLLVSTRGSALYGNVNFADSSTVKHGTTEHSYVIDDFVFLLESIVRFSLQSMHVILRDATAGVHFVGVVLYGALWK